MPSCSSLLIRTALLMLQSPQLIPALLWINIISACTDWQNNGISAVSYGNNVKAAKPRWSRLQKLLNGKGNIAILTGLPAMQAACSAWKAMRNILKNYPEIAVATG